MSWFCCFCCCHYRVALSLLVVLLFQQCALCSCVRLQYTHMSLAWSCVCVCVCFAYCSILFFSLSIHMHPSIPSGCVLVRACVYLFGRTDEETYTHINTGLSAQLPFWHAKWTTKLICTQTYRLTRENDVICFES